MAVAPEVALWDRQHARGARLARAVPEQRKRVCFYRSSVGARPGTLCDFSVLGTSLLEQAGCPHGFLGKALCAPRWCGHAAVIL